jgi:hypothetical protein
VSVQRTSRSASRITVLGFALLTAIVAAGCSGDGRQVTGMLSTLHPRVCVAKHAAQGECFPETGITVSRAHVGIGDCVAVEADSDGGRIRRIHRVDRSEHAADCPVGQLPRPVPSPTFTGVSSCGPGLYEVAGPDSVVAAGGCAGHLDHGAAVSLTVHVGDLVSVRPVLERTFDRGLPRPVTADDGILTPVGSDPVSAWFRASLPGRTPLRAKTYFCGSYAGSTTPAKDDWQTCPVVRIRVTAANSS